MRNGMTHSQIVVGAGAAAAADTTIGTIIMPADGPHRVHHIFAQAVSATQTAGESLIAGAIVQSVSGDITPNPSPSHFPVPESGSALGATLGQPVCPLHLLPVDCIAQGKASVNMILRQYTANTAAPQAVMGLIFSPTIPATVPAHNYDTVRAQVNAAAETAVGTITIAQGNHRIVGITGHVVQDNVITTAEELIGFFRLASDDVDLAPSMWPFSNAFGAGLGALIQGATGMHTTMIPVDIPVPGGARINVTVDLNNALTNAAEVVVTLAYI